MDFGTIAQELLTNLDVVQVLFDTIRWPSDVIDVHFPDSVQTDEAFGILVAKLVRRNCEWHGGPSRIADDEINECHSIFQGLASETLRSTMGFMKQVVAIEPAFLRRY